MTRELFEKCLDDSSKKVQHLTDDIEWQDIVEKYNLGIHYDTLRKSQQPTPFGGAFIKEYFADKYSNSENNGYFKKIQIEKQEIQKEKQKLFDERRDLNNRLREESRLEESFDRLESVLSSIGDKRYIKYSPKYSESDNTLLVCLSDLHIGSCFDNFNGNYNSDIAKDRMNKYLSRIIEIKNIHKAENCVIAGIGDLLSGDIHFTISVTNREHIVEQIKLMCEMVSDFVYEIGKQFNNVKVVNVGGNHTRTTKKDDALLCDRLDNLVPWFMKVALKDCENIEIVEEMIDDTLAEISIYDKTYYFVHGDFDGMSDSAISKLCMWSGKTPYAIIMGHKHFPASTEVAGIKVIQSGSMVGCGDEFTRSKRLSGKPNQTVMVCDKNGIACTYNVELA